MTGGSLKKFAWGIMGGLGLIILGAGPSWSASADLGQEPQPPTGRLVATESPTPVVDEEQTDMSGQEDSASTAVDDKAPTPPPTPKPTPVKTPAKNEGLRGFGLRLAGIPGTGVDFPGQTTPMVGYRQWLANGRSLEWLAGIGSSFGAVAKSGSSDYVSVHAGGMLVRNLGEPAGGLFVQWTNSLIGTVSWAQGNPSDPWGLAVDAFTGVGFEYFIPGLKSLSLESGVGIDLNLKLLTDAQGVSAGGASVNSQYDAVTARLLGGIPLFGAIHWYY
jgi:hypothetical protein